MKTEFPKSYDYIYKLIEMGVTELSMLSHVQRHSLATWLLEDSPTDRVSEMLILDRFKANKMAEFLISNSENRINAFKDRLCDWVLDECKWDIADIFERALTEFNWDTRDLPAYRIPSDFEDWTLQDNSMRALDFK